MLPLLQHNPITLLAIDEAHCISDWGHNFRPNYKRVVSILSFMPENIPVLATTATANQRVIDDVITQLGNNINVLRGKLTRYSLPLQNIYLPKLEGTDIIYTATTRDADFVSKWFINQGIEVETYHSAIKPKRRLELEDSLLPWFVWIM